MKKWKRKKYKIRKQKTKNKKLIILMATCFLISSIISFITCYIMSPKIDIEKKEIILQVGNDYQSPEYQAMAQNKDVSNLVKINGKVNNKKLGTYPITYSIKYSIFETKKTINVKVVDEEKPTIELTGEEDMTICPNKEYEEPGYKAEDNYDGDVTDKVTITKKENQIKYIVKDSSNNIAEKKRKITKDDITKPTITLEGNEVMTIYVGSTYSEPGYKAEDNCDGDITSNVKTTGSVDTSTAGTYTITYQVEDNKHNETTITRTIKVVTRNVARGSGIVYLTFDDGPNEGTTNIILDILKEEGVKATFFVTCNGPDYLIKRMYDEGHTVALHTATHSYEYVYSSMENYFADLNRISNKVEQITGEKSKIIRFPGGSSNTVSRHYNTGIMTRLTKEVVNRGYHYFDWNVDSNDAGGANASQTVYNNVINGISKSKDNVVLMHDVKTATRDAIRNIIRYGKQNGYTFEKITYDTRMVTHGVNN